MGVITGSLSDILATYHSPGYAELAVVIIDEDPHWITLETTESAYVRRVAQTHVLRKAKALNCRVVTVDLQRSKTLLERNAHIKSVVNEADFSFIKECTGVLGASGSVELLNFFERSNVTSLLLMGGNVDCCVCDSVMGWETYPGLSTYGFSILTTSKILSPYKEDKYSMTPRFRPDARMLGCGPIFKSDNPTARSDLLNISDHRFYKTSEEKHGEWPLFVFQKGVRFYLDI